MSIGGILFSLNGRLNRKPYWIISLLFLALILAVTFISITIDVRLMQAAMESSDSIELPPQTANFLILGISLLLIYPSTAVMVKRFHDLGKSGRWALLLLVPALGKMATDVLGLTGQEIPLSEFNIDGTESFFEAWKKGIAAEIRIRPIEFAVGVYIFVVTVWFLIELGFYRGTSGPNRFGPDPLASEPAR